MDIKIKRIYEDAKKDDGYRILIDRIWPRGMKKEEAGIDLWLKDIAPSTELRKWFNHEPEKWTEFKKRYQKELSAKQDLIKELREKAKTHKVITLLYGAKDEQHNNAVALQEYLKSL